MSTLTIGAWNLHDAADEDKVRHQLARARDLDADVWAVQECKHWGHTMLDLAERELDLRGYLARSNNDGCHLALFVREPVIQVMAERHRNSPPYWHGVYCLQTVVEGFGALDLVSCHLAPSSPQIRLAEAETWQLLKKRPTIAGGDYNAVPAQGPLPPLPKGANEETKEQWRRKCDRRAAEAIEAVGFVDTGAVCGDDTPTVGYNSADRLAYRCDRIYVRLPGGQAAVVSHRVVTGWEELSDHRPVVATVALTTTRAR